MWRMTLLFKSIIMRLFLYGLAVGCEYKWLQLNVYSLFFFSFFLSFEAMLAFNRERRLLTLSFSFQLLILQLIYVHKIRINLFLKTSQVIKVQVHQKLPMNCAYWSFTAQYCKHSLIHNLSLSQKVTKTN